MQNYDALNRLASIGDLIRYENVGSRLVARSLSNGITQAWNYDANARLHEIASSVARVQYERTPAGLKSAIVRPELGKRWDYLLNRNGWITREAVALSDSKTSSIVSSTDYLLDRNLNYRSISRTALVDQIPQSTTINTETNNRNQYTAFGTLNPRWDANGNLQSLGGVAVQYDSENHLARASSGLEITYAGSGRKVREKTGATTRDYVPSGDQVIEEYENRALSARYVRGRGIDEIVRAELGGATLFPLQDELGNVERLTDSSGTTLQRFEYEGYGKFQSFGSSTLNWRWLFQGREYEPSLGAYDFRARTLWPEMGRFGQEDPAGAINHPNLYQSFLGNWSGNIDPSGQVVLLMHGISDDGMNGGWAQEVADALTGQWTIDGADPGQDVALLNNRTPNGKQFGKGDAWLAAQGTLNDDTMSAGLRTAAMLHLVRAQLDASKSRKGEPLQVIAHSHGTAMLLAAARQSTSALPVGTALLVGSDLDAFMDPKALAGMARMIHSFYSPGDAVTGLPTVSAAGHRGFVEKVFDPNSEPSYQVRVRPDTATFKQHLVPGIGHSADYEQREAGKVSWVSWQLAKQYYAPLTAIKTPRPAAEPQPWIDLYERLRTQMGRQWTIDLPDAFKQSYQPR